MAEQMQEIKRRMKSIGSTERITNAMQLVSAAKLRKTKKRYESAKVYMNDLISNMNEVFAHTEDVPEEFLEGYRKIKNKCCIVVTSNNGFCGSFNSNVIRRAASYLKELKDSEYNVRVITLGTKGRDYFSHHGQELLMHIDTPADEVTFDEAGKISETVMELYRRGEIDEVDVICTSYVNPLVQEVRLKKLLPLGHDDNDIKTENSIRHNIEYEPSAEEVFNYMVPKYLQLMIYSICIESSTCEYAAKRMAMEGAHNNAEEMLENLEVMYHRARQTEITNEIIEIVAGSQANK